MPVEVRTPVALGESLFGKGCGLSSSRSKVIGPSVQDIASIYKAKKGILCIPSRRRCANRPSQYEVMKTNFVITKAMSEEELKGLEAYIYSKLQ
jgi:cytochrome c